MLPKPPKRVRDKALLARFAATRPWCQACRWEPFQDVLVGLHIHHMTDNPEISRRSDVQDNLMRLCWNCHGRFHSGAQWTKAELRQHREDDHHDNAEEYADMEDQYDREVRDG